MTMIKLNLVADIKSLLVVDRFQKENQPVLLQTAANRYVQFLRKRFISLSSGGGEWTKLKAITILAKIHRGIADNPAAILREYDFLLEAIDSKVVGNRIFVGITRDSRHPRARSVAFLARVHTRGSRKLPARRVVAAPDNQTRKRMVKDIRDQYNKIIRRNKRT